MKVEIIPNTFNSGKFNEIANHPLQTWQWGEARRKMGIEVLRLGEFENQNLLHVFQITLHPLPKLPWKVGYLPRSVDPGRDVLQFLKEYGEKNKIIFFKIEPYTQKTDWKMEIRNWKLNIIPSLHPLFPAWTQILDLTKTEDQLLARMHPKTRYNIRLAQKRELR